MRDTEDSTTDRPTSAKRSTASSAALPSALECVQQIRQQIGGRDLAVFLDYDGTLTPIVDRPELALLPEPMRETVRRLARRATVAVISGRELADVRRLVGIDGIFYSGSHGYQIEGPGGWRLELEQAASFLPVLDRAERRLRAGLRGVPGVLVERKQFSLAVHYRLVDELDAGMVETIVAETAAAHPELRRAQGKMVHELRPALDWDKGKALLWLLEVLHLDPTKAFPLVLGDDITDEDAFAVVRDTGVGILIRDEDRLTAARYVLDNTDEARQFLEAITPGK